MSLKKIVDCNPKDFYGSDVMIINPNMDFVVVLKDKELQVHDMKTGKLHIKFHLIVDFPYVHFKFSPNGEFFTILDTNKNEIHIIEFYCYEEKIISLYSHQQIDILAFSSDSKFVALLYITDDDYFRCLIFNSYTCRLVSDLESYKCDYEYYNPTEPQFNRDAKYIAYLEDKKFINVWHITSGKIILNLRCRKNKEISHMLFSPTDPKHLIVNYESVVKIYDVESGDEIKRIDNILSNPNHKSVDKLIITPSSGSILALSSDLNMFIITNIFFDRRLSGGTTTYDKNFKIKDITYNGKYLVRLNKLSYEISERYFDEEIDNYDYEKRIVQESFDHKVKNGSVKISPKGNRFMIKIPDRLIIYKKN